MENQFALLMANKYGRQISEKLLKNNELQVENIKLKNENDQKLVKNHLLSLKQKYNINIKIDDTVRWAFDFPGWLGSLNFNESRVKKYMVIGLEPHIEQFDFQITYGLSDKTPIDDVPRFSIDKQKIDFIQCRNDSSIIWTNLFKLFANGSTFTSVFEYGDVKLLDQFLSQFYITDLCHFAPQDKANAIFEINEWPKIRSEVASKFLGEEIELINPELVITQGAGVFNKVCEILKIQDVRNLKVAVNSQNWNIWIGTSQNTKILSIPHIGSLMINKTFWLKNLPAVKSILINQKIVGD